MLKLRNSFWAKVKSRVASERSNTELPINKEETNAVTKISMLKPQKYLMWHLKPPKYIGPIILRSFLTDNFY